MATEYGQISPYLGESEESKSGLARHILPMLLETLFGTDYADKINQGGLFKNISSGYGDTTNSVDIFGGRPISSFLAKPASEYDDYIAKQYDMPAYMSSRSRPESFGDKYLVEGTGTSESHDEDIDALKALQNRLTATMGDVLSPTDMQGDIKGFQKGTERQVSQHQSDYVSSLRNMMYGGRKGSGDDIYQKYVSNIESLKDIESANIKGRQKQFASNWTEELADIIGSFG